MTMITATHRRLLCALLCLTAGFFQEQASSADRSDRQAVVAGQGGVQVTMGDIDTFADRIPESDRAHFFDNPKRIEALINNMLLQKQLAALARSEGVDKSPDLLKAAAEGGISDEVLAKAEMNRFRTEIKVPDMAALAQEEYLAHKEQYATPAVLEVRHILISLNSRSEQDAQSIADRAYEEVTKNPSQFEDLVEKYSDDPSKAGNEGVLKQVDEKTYDADLVAAARKLEKPGEISPLVKTSYGFEIIKLIKKEPAKPRSYDEVKDQIVETLRASYTEKTLKERIDTLRNKPLDANPELVASLRDRYRISVAPAKAEEKPAKKSKR
jgi:peptidyl-prolyl cis-trans isomerase C